MQKTTTRLYDELEESALIKRCVQYAQWTVPAVFPEYTNTKSQEVLYDYQSIGAMLSHSLATRLAQLLFPTNTSFFKLSFENLGELSKEEQIGLGALELKTIERLFENASYAKLVQALLLLVITGNALLVRKSGEFQVYSLRNYVVRRNQYGKPTCIILREQVRNADLPLEVRSKLGMVDTQHDDVMLTLYTRCELMRNAAGHEYWEEWQEINSQEVSAQRGHYPVNLCPYVPVTWQLYSGANHGRGYVELYAGDFIRLSELSAALGQYELESCNIKYLYDPQSYTDVDSLTSAPMGSVVQGNPNSISALESGQYQKIQTLGASIQTVFQRLAQAFMYGVNQREGERVTAYEIHLAAQQAEQSLGGVYSQLSHALHLPLAYLLCYEVHPETGVAIASGALKANIVTGIPALSRSADLQQWMMLGQELGTLIPVLQQVSPRFNTEAIVDVFMQAHGLSPAAVMFTGEELNKRMRELQAQQEAAQQQIRTINSQDALVEATEQIGEQV